MRPRIPLDVRPLGGFRGAGLNDGLFLETMFSSWHLILDYSFDRHIVSALFDMCAISICHDKDAKNPLQQCSGSISTIVFRDATHC